MTQRLTARPLPAPPRPPGAAPQKHLILSRHQAIKPAIAPPPPPLTIHCVPPSHTQNYILEHWSRQQNTQHVLPRLISIRQRQGGVGERGLYPPPLHHASPLRIVTGCEYNYSFYFLPAETDGTAKGRAQPGQLESPPRHATPFSVGSYRHRHLFPKKTKYLSATLPHPTQHLVPCPSTRRRWP